MKKYYFISGTWIETMKEFHEAVKMVLHLPDYYGANMDALYDVLTERTTETIIVIEGWKIMEERLGSQAAVLKQLFEDAEKANPLFQILYR